MPDWSRRRALQTATGLLLPALAGCNDTTTETKSAPRRYRDSLEGITVLKIRNIAADPLVLRDGDAATEQPTTERARSRRANIMDHVTEMDAADGQGLVFQMDVPGTSELRGFFEETDFESESIYLSQSSVRECYDRHLTGVYRDTDSVDAQFCRQLRPADVECSTDEYDITAFAIRLPFPGDDFNGVGGGHSSSCDRPERPLIEPDTSHVVGEDGGAE